jgi:hypothetical protein
VGTSGLEVEQEVGTKEGQIRNPKQIITKPRNFESTK